MIIPITESYVVIICILGGLALDAIVERLSL